LLKLVQVQAKKKKIACRSTSFFDNKFSCELVVKCNKYNLVVKFRSAKFDAKFFNFFARLLILFYFQSEKFCTSVKDKIK